MLDQLKRWLSRPDVRTPLIIGGGTRLLIILVAFVALKFMGAPEKERFLLHGGKPHPIKLINNFKKFDSYWFLNIARNGYQYFGVQEQMDRKRRVHKNETNITPFPLYPLSIWLLHQAVGDMTLSGFMISLFCYLGAMMIFYRMVRLDWDHELATRAVLYLSIYPTAWLYNALYSESLFLLLTLLCLYKARQGQPVAAGLAGMGASMTRIAGGLMALPVFAEFLFGRTTKPNLKRLFPALLAAALTSAGWLLYFAYLYGLTDNFFIYFKAQQGWHKGFAMPWTALWHLLGPGLFSSGQRLTELLALLLFLPLTVASVRRQRLSYSLVVALGLLMPICVTNTLGLPRYLMVLYPAFIIMAQWGKNRHVHNAISVGFPLLMGTLMMVWIMWKHSF